jgi:CheY-like chemotaxis protein
VTTPDTTPEIRPLGVLVADDEEALLILLNSVLRQHGFAVWVASDGRQALDQYDAHRGEIDLVLLDVRMPGLDGPATLKELRQRNPAVRCCFMSGHLGEHREHDLIDLGAWRVIPKPFRLVDVVELLRQVPAA